MYKILSLDGGGIRGIIAAIWLRELGREIGRPLHEVFDLIAGSSTGAILAAAIAFDVDLNVVVNLYKERGKLIFPPLRERRRNLWNLGSLRG